MLLVRRLVTLHGDEPTLTAQHLPERIGAPAPRGRTGKLCLRAAASGRTPAPTGSAEPLELPALMAALRAAGGNVARAAAMLGITRQRAYRLMEGQAVDLEALRRSEEPRG